MFRAMPWIVWMFVMCSGCSTLPNHFEQAPMPDSKAVVFDIDGTLTPTPQRFWQARDDAARAVKTFADDGYRIFYVTARTPFLQSQIPGWLKDNDFPQGELYLTQTDEDQDDHARFKIRILQQLQQNGWRIEWAFGDSSSDFEAYRAVGVPVARIIALQRACDDECQPGEWRQCVKDWRPVLEADLSRRNTPARCC